MSTETVMAQLNLSSEEWDALPESVQSKLTDHFAGSRANLDDIARAKAIEHYGSDDIEFSAHAPVSHADNGVWVQAWVWVSDSELEE